MNRIHTNMIVAIVACAALLGINEADAQARASGASKSPDKSDHLTAATRTQRLVELDAWLRRLVGQFRYSGDFSHSALSFCDELKISDPRTGCSGYQVPPTVKVHGSGNCVGFGAGPGVHCIVNVDWKVISGYDILGVLQPSWLAPGMILYGLDPDAPGIRYLQASNRSIAEGQLGELKGDIVTFKPPCKISSLFRSRCKAVMEIEAPPDGQDIEIRIRETGQNGAGNPSTVIHYKFKLERLQPSQADEASGAR